MRLLFLAALMASLAARAQAVPLRIAFSARVTDNGAPLTGNHTVVVKLFDVSTAGTALWTETYTGHPVNDGVVSATLGSMTPLMSTLFDGGVLFAELTIDATTLAPRTQLVSTPFAIRAGAADKLGTNVAADFALASHSHSYLPVGAMLTCSGTEKVTGLTSSGNVVCGADTDTNTTYSAGAGLSLSGTQLAVAFAGTGAAATAARSDHNHAGTYLPLGVTLACPATLKMTALNANGSVTCAADVDTVTTFAGTGTSTSAARADHTHTPTCPVGYLTHSTSLCSKRVAQTSTWNEAARACPASHAGGTLCLYRDLVVATSQGALFQTLVASYWLGDRTGDNTVLRTNGTNPLDFDEQVDTATSPTSAGFYCCTTPQ